MLQPYVVMVFPRPAVLYADEHRTVDLYMQELYVSAVYKSRVNEGRTIFTRC